MGINIVLDVQNIEKHYGKPPNELSVLNKLSLKVKRGEKIAIMGASGSGKTTLLNLLGGLDDPDYGSISVCENNLSKLSISERAIWRNQHVGFVYQFHHLLEEFSALENVALPLLIAGQSMISAKETSGKFLTSIGLEGRLGHRPSQLSGGERQRVAVIRGLINKPSVLLLDEPTGNLDSDSAKKTLDLILQLSKTLSMAIVLVTHDTFVAKNMDVTYRLMDGSLEEK